MKKILGLDLGTTSIGWAMVNEAENENEKSEIIKLGVRVIPITTDEVGDFLKGKATSINADRTLKRGARRNLNRFQLRRNALIKILKTQNIISNFTLLNEEGKQSTFDTYKLRAKAAQEQISKDELAKVFLMINKKRGYKSSRKAKTEDEGIAIDGMAIAKELYANNYTPGQIVFQLLTNGKKYIPDFYRSDLQNELQKIWDYHLQFYPDILTNKFFEQLKNKGKQATSKIFLGKYGIFTFENKGKRDEVKLHSYKLRSEGINKQLSKEELAYVIAEINNNIYSSSGYLGAISDRSKELFFNKQTVGEYLYSQLEKNKHSRLKNQVFYRQDYLDEFNTIWETQKQFHPELTEALKSEIRDVIIFYQRKLKSQKGLLSFCEFESKEEEYFDKVENKLKKRIIGPKVISRSSPLFQEFKIWQILNNIRLTDKTTGEYGSLSDEMKLQAFERLNIVHKLSANDFLKIIVDNPKDFEINYESVEGNKTNVELFNAYQKILELEGVDLDFSKLEVSEIIETIKSKFQKLNISTEILFFNSEIDGNDFDKQPIMQLWHLLYSIEDDKKLIEIIEQKFGFNKEYAKLIANISLQDDYGNLSSRAIRKILPDLREGNSYDAACTLAGYNHSNSLNREQLANRVLKDKLELLPKNSLRNPVVEKILNQMVNVINAIIEDETLGKPDEIRIELARELKKSADERKKMTDGIRTSTAENEVIKKLLQSDFCINKVTRNDIIRYKLWKELENNGYKTLYTNTYIPKEKVFSKEFDIEHIIPQAKLFDDSFSNKTLTKREINIEKGNDTAYDYLKNKLNESDFNQYLSRIERLYKNGNINKAKYNKLKMKSADIPEGFIDRDLRNSQYIAKKAKQMLEEVVRRVNTTTGSITSRLREDWQLINVMKEINLPKYEMLGLVNTIQGKNGQQEKIIVDWSKRNDHRHHAMDALTVAFTSYSHVQYLNNLKARGNKRHEKYHEVYGIEQKYLYRDDKNKLLFIPPMPLKEFREDAKKHIESILISFKAKNKVVTRNKNKIKIKGRDNYKEHIELTPRGQLHNETVYGQIKQYETKEEKVGVKFDLPKIKLVAKQQFREALLIRLAQFGGDPKVAFGGDNAPSKNPIYIDLNNKIVLPEKVKLVSQSSQFTIRKEVSPDLKLEKVIDVGVRRILQNRLDEFGGEPKKAFVNLDENPIWFNEDKGFSIKRVTITGVSNAQALHNKKDHSGNLILDKNGNTQPVDFVSTSNNHHVAIYRDEEGNLQDDVVSFYEAVQRANNGLPLVDKNKNGWDFLFTMKQNEYFVFPSFDFNPDEIDLFNSTNSDIISPHLFRVQTLSKVVYGNNAIRDFVFRHHLETNVDKKTILKGITYHPIKSLNNLEGIIKVRINHLGKIVKVGEE
ncbi:MAG: type II CRISPR RNA-guided endonuclease Cas9 [Bacteroidetes bacterium]|nr:type II CRISPR RNA-guided endonuclease Cas9 [Bacteroidota bacterium]MBU1113770.1 type II CRISPR RNA-guided endonuclease Cas9 [Bacteroidota bacterium]MBU1797954.1 type II CRISPR RNA-guided endonuclease Cas9 [Bacteroidota bacterium]